MATVLGALIGIPLGASVGLRARPTARLFRIVLYTLYALPPVLAGLLGYLVLSRSGPLGGLDLLFTPTAIVLVETLLTTPIIAGLTVAALTEVPATVRDAVNASGASPARATLTIVSEARLGVTAGILVAFGRALAEVAGALMVGGNIRHETRTLGTSILQSTNQGDFGLAMALGGLLLGLALFTVLVVVRIQRVDRGGGAP